MRGTTHLEPARRLKRPTVALFCALVCLLLALVPVSAQARTTASIDRTSISFGDIVRLVIETDDEADSRPDLSVLASDFQVVDRNTSHSVSIINGQRTERHTLMLSLLPRRAGELQIPAIPVGDAATAALQLSVAERVSGASPPVGGGKSSGASPGEPSGDGSAKPPPLPTAWLEVSIEPTEARVGQQLVLTAKVFMDGLIPGPRLHHPQIPNADVFPLGEDQYQAQRDGRDYRVYERRFALFPRAPGQLEIGTVLFEGRGSDVGGAPSGIGYRPGGHPVEARSESPGAKVLPIPDGAGRDRWLPARAVTLSESGPEIYRVGVGEPVGRHISVRAEGIRAQDLPVLTVPVPYQLTKQQDKPRQWNERRPEGVIGIRQEIVTLTPREPGRYRLPPVSLDWWSTDNERWETAILPARELVASTARGIDTAPPPSAAELPPRSVLSQGPDQPTDQPPAASETKGKDADESGSFWTWIAVALALAWVATMAARRRSKNPQDAPGYEPAVPTPPEVKDEADPLADKIDAVRAAYGSGNADAAREAILAWAAAALPEQAPSNLARLAKRCPEPLRGQILLLEEAFFSPVPIPWDKESIWEQLPEFVPAPREEPASFRRPKPIRRRAPNPDAE